MRLFQKTPEIMILYADVVVCAIVWSAHLGICSFKRCCEYSVCCYALQEYNCSLHKTQLVAARGTEVLLTFGDIDSYRYIQSGKYLPMYCTTAL